MNTLFYKCCAVPMCKSTSISTPQKLFIHVPKSAEIRRKWLTIARRDPHSLTPKSTSHFCEDHFDLEKDMENYVEYTTMGVVSRIRMRSGCLPTKFACQPTSTITNVCQPATIKSEDEPPWSPKSDNLVSNKHMARQTSASNGSTKFKRKKVNGPEVATDTDSKTNLEIIKIIKVESELQQTQPLWLVADQACQVDISIQNNSKETQKTFICNRYIYNDHCEAEIQVEIITPSIPRKKGKKLYVDQPTEEINQKSYEISFIKTEQPESD